MATEENLLNDRYKKIALVEECGEFNRSFKVRDLDDNKNM